MAKTLAIISIAVLAMLLCGRCNCQLCTLTVDELAMVLSERESLFSLGNVQSNPATSCQDILDDNPNAASGNYFLTNNDPTTPMAVSVYCDFTSGVGDDCGGAGWIRVANIDMSDPAQQCDIMNGETVVDTNVRVCGRPITETMGSCSDIPVPTNGFQFNEVCGRVLGYSEGTPNVFDNGEAIDGPYLDGVAIKTVDAAQMQEHVWSFASAEDGALQTCDCTGGGSEPAFVGMDFFCETRDSAADLLWDGAQCVSDDIVQQGCCSNPVIGFQIPPNRFFATGVSGAATDDLLISVCGTDAAGTVNSYFSNVELYIRDVVP